VRRNKLSDFIGIKRNGKIAMKLDEGDAIIGVGVCNADRNDILLTTALGRCIRFAVDEVRVFAGRDSTGVRGIRLAEGDTVISMAILRSVEATADERAAYVKQANANRRDGGRRGRNGWRGGAFGRTLRPARRGGGGDPHRLDRRLWQADLGL
jgi:DNA gyrase subunit A